MVISWGMHPPTMLTPLSLCSCMISAFISLRLGSVTLYFLYFSLMASVCGWMRCILSALCMVFTRKGRMSRLMKTVRMMIAQPQEPLHLAVMWAWMACSDRKRYLAMGPQKPNSSIRFQRDARIGGMDALEYIDRLGADEDARLDRSAGVAQGSAQDGHDPAPSWAANRSRSLRA